MGVENSSSSNMMSSVDQTNDMIASRIKEGVTNSGRLNAEAVDYALWHMEASNAMAKIKGIYSLAKTANEMT